MQPPTTDLVPLPLEQRSARLQGRVFNRLRRLNATAAGVERSADATLVASFRGLPFARAEGVIVVPCSSGAVLVCGGAIGVERNLSDVQRWCGAWEVLAPLPHPRAHAFGVELRDTSEIVLLGGHVAAWHGDDVSPTVDHFDGATWHSFPLSFDGPQERGGAAVTCYDEQTGRVFRLEAEARAVRLWRYAGGGRFALSARIPLAASVAHDLSELAVAFDVDARELVVVGRTRSGEDVAVHAAIGALLDALPPPAASR